MSSRRAFLGQVATGLSSFAAAPRKPLTAADRIRLGVIGYGDRGSALAREALACAETQVTAVCDVYSANLERAQSEIEGVQVFPDHRALLQSAAVDAVIIATPQHQHAIPFVNAIRAGKHVFQEKTMAFTVDEAKQMRAAYQSANHRPCVQVGHQSCSFGQVADALQMLAHGKVGQITAIHASMFRNTPHGRQQWARPLYPNMNAQNIQWNEFLGDAPPRPFDAQRFRNWRFYWDYSGGNVHENMSHQLSFWTKVLGLQIPYSASMTGASLLPGEGQEVPDTMNVSLFHAAEGLFFNWNSGFGNGSPGTVETVLGTDGTIARGAQIRYAPEKVNRPGGETIVGTTPTPSLAHMQNFVDSIRSGKEPNCPFEIGYRVSIACRMAVDSFHLGRTVYWDAAAEAIV